MIAPSWIRTSNFERAAGIFEAEKMSRQQQMPGRGYRNKFGQSLDDAE
jgi:hypothetical protein